MSDIVAPTPAVAPDAGATPVDPANQQKVQLICPKHGDVTTTALLLNFQQGDKPQQFIYCLPCLNEVLLALQKEGAIQTLQVNLLNADGTPVIPVPPADPTLDAVKKVLPGLTPVVAPAPTDNAAPV
jgi:hypothetical protein